jgi:hypothetical protein
MTRLELTTLTKGEHYVIRWDRSGIVEVLYRQKGRGVHAFTVTNAVTKKRYHLPNMSTHHFTILNENQYVCLGDLLPKGFQDVV